MNHKGEYNWSVNNARSSSMAIIPVLLIAAGFVLLLMAFAVSSIEMMGEALEGKPVKPDTHEHRQGYDDYNDEGELPPWRAAE